MVTHIGGRGRSRVFLDEWIARKELSNADIARRLDVDRATVGKWRAKAQRLRLEQLRALADALDISFNDLFHLPPPQDAPPPRPSVDAMMKDMPPDMQDAVIDLARRLSRRTS